MSRAMSEAVPEKVKRSCAAVLAGDFLVTEGMV